MKTLRVCPAQLPVVVVSFFAAMIAADAAFAQAVVPGSGRRVKNVGDDFEDPDWKYIANLPKVYNLKEEMEAKNSPTGKSKNGRWFEGQKRGQPDYIRRVRTPGGGIPLSTGALALRSLQTGVARKPSFTQQQDDFIANVQYKIGKVDVARVPSVVTRVYLPPVTEWENRSGCHFAFRLALETTPRPAKGGGLFGGPKDEGFDGIYWPGMFIDFKSQVLDRKTKQRNDYATIRIKADSRGNQPTIKQIEQTGWWTLGMSVTPDGMVHYYAKPGVGDLTKDDFLTSQYPYGFKALRFRTFFFNVCNADDNKTWSTEWVIDDPMLYLSR